MDHPWLKDEIQYDPYDELDYPQPQDAIENRPQYRSPSVERAVKVYTVAQESRYLIIRNIPVTNVVKELIQQLALYGVIEEYNWIHDLPSAPFTQTILVKFELVSAARQAKHKMNKTSFFGQDLWIQYAPEYESAEDTELKLKGRQFAIQKRLEQLIVERPDSTIREYKRKTRIPVAKMSTGGLLGDEEAIPAGDFIEILRPRVESTIPKLTVNGTNTQPLQRKKRETNIEDVIPVLSNKPIGVLRENEEETRYDGLMQSVVNKLNQIERDSEVSMSTPPIKKRRRI